MSEFGGEYGGDYGSDSADVGGAETGIDTPVETESADGFEFLGEDDNGAGIIDLTAAEGLSAAELAEAQSTIDGDSDGWEPTEEYGPIFSPEPAPVDIKDYDGGNPEFLPGNEEGFPISVPTDDATDDVTDDTTGEPTDETSGEPTDDIPVSGAVEMEEGISYNLHPEDGESNGDVIAEPEGLSDEEFVEAQQALDSDVPIETLNADIPDIPDMTLGDIQADVNEINAEMDLDAGMIGDATSPLALEAGEIPEALPEHAGDAVPVMPEDIQADINAIDAEMELDATMLGGEAAPPEAIETAERPEALPADTVETTAIRPEDNQTDANAINAEMEHDAEMLGGEAGVTQEQDTQADTSGGDALPDAYDGLAGEDAEAEDEIETLAGIPEVLLDPAVEAQTIIEPMEPLGVGTVIPPTEIAEPETAEVLEPNEELPEPEEIDISDINDEKDYFEDSERITGILSDFKPDAWDSKSLEDQKAAIEQLADYNAEVLGVENKPEIEYYYSPKPGEYGGTTTDGKSIRINTYMLNDSKEAADTIAHEYRHVYQQERALRGETDLDSRYRENLDPANYIRGEEDREGYKNQLIERDARAYARGFKNIINNL